MAPFLRDIGRGREGARCLTRQQAAALMHQLLAGHVSDLELGAFCIAMRFKGETAEELLGFLDALESTMTPVPAGHTPTVVLPSYNGARRLPLLTPLLALMLVRHGCRVIMHGHATDPGNRLSGPTVLQALEQRGHAVTWVHSASDIPDHAAVCWVPTACLHPGLQRLLDVRRVLGLRNTAHSLVKLIQPCPNAVLVTSYTHPEYRTSMSAVLTEGQRTAVLLRATEGEPVADPRRTPCIDVFQAGQHRMTLGAESGSLPPQPALPDGRDCAATTAYIESVLAEPDRVPAPIRIQMDIILGLTATYPSRSAMTPPVVGSSLLGAAP